MKITMKTRNIFALAALGLLSLSACSNDDEDLAWQGSETIEIDPSIGAMQARVTGNAFDANDAISLYGWTGQADAVTPEAMVVNNAKYTFDGAKWSTTDGAVWKDKKSTHFFVGVYPQRAITNLTADNFTSTGKEDLMIAYNKDGVTHGNAVALDFKHVLAKLKMTCKFTSEFMTTPVVEKITLKGKHTATVNYLTNAITSAAVELSEVESTKSGDAFEAILIPQEGVVARIYLGKYGIYEYTLDASAPLESGKITTINFTIGKKDETQAASVSRSAWSD